MQHAAQHAEPDSVGFRNVGACFMLRALLIRTSCDLPTRRAAGLLRRVLWRCACRVAAPPHNRVPCHAMP